MHLILLLAAGCQGEKADPAPRASESADTPDTIELLPPGGGGDEAPVDADGDGYDEALDCDDADADVHPAVPEVCDGADNDCDGQVDDGIPTDGAGCADPGSPSFPAVVDVVHVEVRTKDGAYDGSDDPVEVCLSEDACFTLDMPDWDDFQEGGTEVYAFEGVDLPREEITGFTVRTLGGSDQWEPACFAVRLDGEPVYCNDDLDLKIGSDVSEETAAWTDPGGLVSQCASCFGGPLTHGPILGAPEPGAARVWVRTSGAQAVKLRVAPSAADLAAAAPVATRWPGADRDFTETIRVEGLGGGAGWAYDLEIDGTRYGPWSLRAGPDAGSPGRTRIAFGSCAKDEEQPIFGEIAAWAPDLMLFIGDNHYGNTGELNDLRQNYRWAHARTHRAELMTGTATAAVWDDHDFTGNDTDGSDPGRDNALRAFMEYWANASYGLEDAPGIFSKLSYGDLDLFLLDDRYWRGVEGSILGDAQEAWLLAELAASTAPFKLLVSGSQWSYLGGSDSWGDYEDTSDRLREALVTEGVEGVVLLSGDIHRAELRLLEGPPGGYDLPEITSSPLANPGSACPSSGEILACEVGGNYFISLDIDTTLADPALEAAIVDESGGVLATWTILRSELTLP